MSEVSSQAEPVSAQMTEYQLPCLVDLFRRTHKGIFDDAMCAYGTSEGVPLEDRPLVDVFVQARDILSQRLHTIGSVKAKTHLDLPVRPDQLAALAREIVAADEDQKLREYLPGVLVCDN